jgi:very-short-patch-repair endonuclease
MKCGKELWDITQGKIYARKNYLCRMCLFDIDKYPNEAELYRNKYKKYRHKLKTYSYENLIKSTKSAVTAETIIHKIANSIFFFNIKKEVIFEPYIVDFVISHANVKIGIEIDGSIHEKQQNYDEKRDSILLSKYGLPIYRFSNDNILEESFVNAIWGICYEVYQVRMDQINAVAKKYNIKP